MLKLMKRVKKPLPTGNMKFEEIFAKFTERERERERGRERLRTRKKERIQRVIERSFHCGIPYLLCA